MRCAKRIHEMCHDVPRCAKESVSRILGQLSSEERRQRVLVVDNDLEGSCGLKKVQNVGHRGTSWDIVGRGMLFDLL